MIDSPCRVRIGAVCIATDAGRRNTAPGTVVPEPGDNFCPGRLELREGIGVLFKMTTGLAFRFEPNQTPGGAWMTTDFRMQIRVAGPAGTGSTVLFGTLADCPQ